MLTVDDFGQIRRSLRDGESIRSIAKRLHHSRGKVREALANPEPRPYTRSQPPPAPKLGPFHGLIDQILVEDEQAPRKQRHTGTQIFRRLLLEGYLGGYDQVRRYVGRRRRRSRETFIPLEHEPGQRAEADFGHIYADFPEGRRQVPVLLLAWAWSYCPSAIALPTERTEAILHGLVSAFEFFGCVPRELWWDNPTTVAAAILTGRQRTLNPRYAALASHYNFEPLFCLPARGNEKPHVENRVKDLERRWATPVPRVANLEELNAYLRNCCLADRQRVATGRTETIGARFAQEQARALSLPPRPFDACVVEARKVDKYQLVACDGNRYSVPHAYAFATVTAKLYVGRIEIVAGERVIARHPRCYQQGQQLLDPLHYLVTLGRKPACLDHAPVYRNWQLPESFSTLRQTLEARHGPVGGTRQFVRVLQLLQEHPAERLTRAIAQCRDAEGPTAAAIAREADRLRRQAPGSACDLPQNIPAVQVPLPDLSHFDRLLTPTPGEPCHAQDYQSPVSLALEVEPQAVAAAVDAGRV